MKNPIRLIPVIILCFFSLTSYSQKIENGKLSLNFGGEYDSLKATKHKILEVLFSLPESSPIPLMGTFTGAVQQGNVRRGLELIYESPEFILGKSVTWVKTDKNKSVWVAYKFRLSFNDEYYHLTMFQFTKITNGGQYDYNENYVKDPTTTSSKNHLEAIRILRDNLNELLGNNLRQ